ncbi:Mechanosensitive ion channel protein 10 [Hondaea fermentalgiana]|uniref:Mechanosensitive ion channel protein 10 n=1 Tax=Hondaea fermentalgiana TaxID=2315210 RepID=A0A2R5GVL8_9STRA|nr:Mechanosensitive ion channel protein 10 [Hondaea fermentalgiana]|eukprot:GBG32451.1 Mechanosensitive ion channel protein 10 [Hondaea fermentalgiana]
MEGPSMDPLEKNRDSGDDSPDATGEQDGAPLYARVGDVSAEPCEEQQLDGEQYGARVQHDPDQDEKLAAWQGLQHLQQQQQEDDLGNVPWSGEGNEQLQSSWNNQTLDKDEAQFAQELAQQQLGIELQHRLPEEQVHPEVLQPNDPKQAADAEMEMHLQSLSGPTQAEEQAKETLYVADSHESDDKGKNHSDEDWSSDSESTDSNTTAGPLCFCFRGRRFARKLRRYITLRPVRIAIFSVGLILIIVGSFMKAFNVLDDRYLPTALLFTGCSLSSGIIADLIVVSIFWLLSKLVHVSENKEVEYFVTATVFYLGNIRNGLINLLWCLIIIIMLVCWVPRDDNETIVPKWSSAYYHTIRILAILALTILARIISVLLRSYLVQGFGTRSYQEKVKETLGEEIILAKLRRVKPDPVLTSLQSRTQLVIREGGTVGPELWQNLLRYVNSHHVDGLEPRNGHHQAVQPGVDNGLSKRSHPVAISVFAWLVARIDAIKKPTKQQRPNNSTGHSRSASFHSAGTGDSLDDDTLYDRDLDNAWNTNTFDERSATESPPVASLFARSASPPMPPPSSTSSSNVSMQSLARPNLASTRNADRSSMFELAEPAVRSRSSGEVPRARRRKGPTTFAGVMRRAKAALDPIGDSRASTPRSMDRIELLARNEALSYARQKRKAFAKDNGQTRLSLRFLLKQDVLPILQEIDSAFDWDHLWEKYFDPKRNGFVTWHTFKEVITGFYEARYNLALTLADSQAVLKSMDVVIMSVLMMLVITMGLALYSTELVAMLASIGTVIVGYSFVFGSTVASSFENIVFLFGIHQYDVGDSLYMNGDFYTVLRIRLLTTDFLQMDGNFIRLENHQVAAMAPISNLSTSRNHAVRLETFIPTVEATEAFILKLKEKIKTYADNNPHLYAYIIAQARDLMHPMRATGEMAAWGTHPTHTRIIFWVEFSFSFEDVGRVFDAQSQCVVKIGDILTSLGVVKPLLDGPLVGARPSDSDSTAAKVEPHRPRMAPLTGPITASSYMSSQPAAEGRDSPVLQAPIPMRVHYDEHQEFPPRTTTPANY